MARHLAVIVAHHHFAVAGQHDGLDRHRGFFQDFANQRLANRFACFDHAARHGPYTERGAACAAGDKHAAIADDGGAHGQDRPVRIGARIG